MVKKISGITIALDADTKGVTSGLKDITAKSIQVSNELKDVERLLKLNPGNTELLAQKQQLLSEQIENTSDKLEALKGAQADVEKAFKSGDIGAEQYRSFKRELESTEGALNGYKSQLSNMQVEQDKLGQNTKRLSTFFEATETSVDDFSDILGSKLTNAIKEGKANSSQLEEALNKIGRSALGQDADISKMKQSLDSIDDGNSIKSIEADLTSLSGATKETGDDFEKLGEKVDSAINMEAADKLSAVGDKAIEMGQQTMEVAVDVQGAQAKINAAFQGTEEEAARLSEVAKRIYTDGFGESMDQTSDAVILVKRNLGNLNDTDLSNITQQAMILEELYDADMDETMRGVNALMQTFGMTAQEAMDYVVVGTQNGLDKTHELGDNLAEYATLFEENGYSAGEMFDILQAGLEGGAYNLDKVNDLVKEFGIRVSDGTIESAIEDIGGSWQTLYNDWKASGGTQKELFQSIAQELSNVSSEQEKAGLVSQIFGSLGEDAGYKVIEAMGQVTSTYNDVGGAAKKMNEDTTTPMQELTGKIREMQIALAPIGNTIIDALLPVISILSVLSEAFGKLPEPVRLFIVILGGLFALFTLLMPIIAAAAIALPALAGALGLGGAAAAGASIGFGALMASILPILGIFALVVAGITGVILVINNWGTIIDRISNKWRSFKDTLSNVWGVISSTASNLKDSVGSIFDQMASKMSSVIDRIKGIIQGLADKIESVKKMITNTIGKIASAIGNIKLPHFSLKTSSKKILGKKFTYPTGIDVKWFAEGGILTKPTIFGADGNKLLGGGEAGKEAIAPLDKLMGYIRQAVKEEGSGKTGDEIHLHLNAFGNLPKEIMDQMAEYLLYKFTDLKNQKNPFGGGDFI